MAGGEGVAVQPGLELAACWHDKQAVSADAVTITYQAASQAARLQAVAAIHRQCATSLRALAAQVAPGGEEA